MTKHIISITISIFLALGVYAQFPVDTLGGGYNPPEIPVPAEPLPVGPYLPKNYMITYNPLVPMTDPAVVKGAGASQVMRVQVYKNGFNEAFQTETRNISTGKHLIGFANTGAYQDQTDFLPYTVDDQGFRNDPRTEQKAYYAAKYPEEGSTGGHAISLQKITSDATKRTAVGYAPGKNNVGSARGVEIKQVTNAANEVRYWTISTGTPASTAYYGANQLFGEEIKGQHGARSISYTDKAGNLILKKEYEGSGQWIITQYVYDDMGRLRATISPQASRLIGTGGTISTAIWDNLCFQYYYDNLGRLSAEHKPGETGLTELVYDRKDRIVMRRSPLEAAGGKWEVVFYDAKGRTKSTAILTNSETRSVWQTRMETTSPTASLPTTNILYYLCTRAGEKVYPTATISGLTYMNYSYYDNYDVTPSIVLPYDASLFSAETVAGAETVNKLAVPMGMPTFSKVRVLKDAADTDMADWTESIVYYDHKGRVIQSRGTNAMKNGSNVQGLESVSTKYNFTNKPVISSHIHNNKKNNHAYTEETKYVYETGTGRLKQSFHKINSGAWKKLGTFTYDDIGRLSRKELGDNGEVQDYKYNIRGQLTSINEKFTAFGDKEGWSRSFGEQLYYDYGYTTPRYDGRIRGMVWRTNGSRKMQYSYTYDTLGRLTNAHFLESQLGFPLPGWSSIYMDYSVSNITYDANGNMLRMQQRGMGMVGSSIVPVTMDNLTYTYEANSNRLASVSDVVTTDYSNGDFQDGNTGSADYSYDQSGNLTKDLNKGITSITYTHFNKPQVVTFSNGNKIRYVYNGSGIKIKEEVKSGTLIYKRDYIGNAVYKNDTLLYINTEEGRTTYDPVENKYEEEYFVKDHLGNVRSVVEVKAIPFTLEYLATFELASAFTEGILFDMIEEVRAGRPAATMANEYSGMLSRDEYPVGTSVVLKVMAGDRVELSVENMYEEFDQQADNPLDDSELLDQILNTLLTGPGGTPAEGSNAQLIEGLFNPQNFSTFIGLTSGSIDSTKPQAALNYVLYNQQMQVVGSFTGRIQANGEMDWTTIGTGTAMEIPTNGYLAVFLTNKSAHPVYFDDLRVRLTKGVLKEENHYYPHGLPMARIGGTAVGETENRQKHQSNEYIKDAGLNWMDFNFRQYDPQIGRFLGVDPLADYYGQDRFSPYAAMGNQPEGTIDPHGLAIDAGSGGAEFEARWNRYKGFYTSSVSAEIWNSMSWAQRIAFIDAYGQGDIPGMMSFMAYRAIGLGSPGGGGGSKSEKEEEGSANISGSYIYRFTMGSLMLMQAQADLASSAGSGQASVDDPGEKYPGGYKPVQVTDADGTTRTEYQLVSEDEYAGSVLDQLAAKYEWKNFTADVAPYSWGVGLGITGIEKTPGSFRLTNGAYNGSAWSPKYYGSGWAGGSRARITTYNIGNIGKAASRAVTVVGVAMDGYSWYNGDMSGTKFGVNTGMAIWGMTGVGTIPAVFYFGAEAFYPGGALQLFNDSSKWHEDTKRILGPGWRPIPFGPK